MIEKYIQAARLNNLAIASDVSKGVISKQNIAILVKEIDSAIKEELISNPYIKTSYFPKISKHWDKKYLDHLVSVAASSECFNEDYLLYLADVSEYVRNGLKRTASRFLIFVILLLLAFVIGNRTGNSNTNNLQEEINNISSELISVNEEKDKLEKKLSSYSDYDDIKNERDTAKSELSKLYKMPLDEILMRQASRKDNTEDDLKRLRKSFKDSAYKTSDIDETAQKMGLSKEDMKTVISALEIPEEKIDLNNYSEKKER